MKKLLFSLFSILVLALAPLSAQQFGAGIIAGATASQINGDYSAGYNKLGLSAGILATIRIDEKKYIGLEMLYSQRGSQDRYFSKTGQGLFVHLQYVSVPIYFGLKDWYRENDDYYKMHFQAGLSYGRLIKAAWNKSESDPRAVELNKNDISFLLGATFFLNKKLGFNARYNRSINLLAKNNTFTYKFNLRSHFLSFAIIYRIL